MRNLGALVVLGYTITILRNAHNSIGNYLGLFFHEKTLTILRNPHNSIGNYLGPYIKGSLQGPPFIMFIEPAAPAAALKQRNR